MRESRTELRPELMAALVRQAHQERAAAIAAALKRLAVLAAAGARLLRRLIVHERPSNRVRLST